MKNINIKNIYRIAILFLLFVSCKDDIVDKIDNPDYSLSEYLYELMINEKWYLWVDEITPEKPLANEHPSDYIKRIRYDKYDKWSYVQDIYTHDAYFSSGTYVGYGFLALKHSDNTLRFGLVFANSPMGEKEVKRGYKLISIDGKSAIDLYNDDKYNETLNDKTSHSFTVEDYNGVQNTFTLNKAQIEQPTILDSSIYTINDKKVAYFVFNSFIQPSFYELNDLFSDYKKDGIDELIVDLRYNGGGQVNVAIFLGSLIAGKTANGKVFNTFQYNSYKSAYSTSDYFILFENSIDLDRVFFITTSASASASELVINSLKPFVDVYIIGEPSHGKPVGMRTFRYMDMVAAPITFKGVNADGDGDYFGGIPVDGPASDGLDKGFGDVDEACLKQALHYIENGTFLDSAQLKSYTTQPREFPLEGFQRLIGAH